MIRTHGVSPALDRRRIADLLRPWHPSGSDRTEHYAAIGLGEPLRPGGDDTTSEPAVTIVVVARRHRIGLARRLRRAGLHPEASVLLVPGWPHAEHLLTIGPSLPDGVRRHLGDGRSMSVLGWLGARPWGHRIIALLAPSVGTVATTGATTTMSAWFAPEMSGPIDLHVSARPRRDAPTRLALVYRRGDTSPTAVVKSASTTAGIERLDAERWGLTEIGRRAETAGLAVPHVISEGVDHFAMSAISGRPLDRLLSDRPEQLEPLAIQVLTILGHWQLETVAPRHLTDASTVALTDQLATVTAAHPNLAAYARAIETLIEATSRGRTPMVARHGDLTAANVVRSAADGTIGFLDWESAKRCSLPTTDDWYFAADAIAVAQSCSHADAVEVLATSGDGPTRRLVEHIIHTQSSLAMSAAVATLAFHATWIDHAYDDVVRGTSTARFVAVLHRLHDLAPIGGVTTVTSP